LDLAISKGGRKKTNQQGSARTALSHGRREPNLGAPRIHGELLKLGFEISERTVSRWMKRSTIPIPRDAGWLFSATIAKPSLPWISE
jgi:hypothetical protein